MNFLNKIFPSYNQRKVKEYMISVNEINALFENMKTENNIVPEDKTREFIKRIEDGEQVDDILTEAFALVKYVMFKLSNEKFEYSDSDMHFIWEMVPYDVQIVGSIGLHKGNIIEMATGEGKTLVAVMPLYLNSLAKKGSYLVTVNDYLAKRDRAWMKPIYDRLGVSVGLIQMGMSPAERRDNYNNDITYVTNNELGFDYLRDNMAFQKSDKVHRDDYCYAIIDEVDSVLIDEARTPLIISGMPMGSIDEKHTESLYKSIASQVNQFSRDQKEITKKIFEKSMKLYEEKKFDDAVAGFLTVKRGYPKMKEIVEVMQDAEKLSKMEKLENVYIRDKIVHTLDAELLFSIDEKSGAVTITDKGEDVFSSLSRNPDFFNTPELSIEYKKIDEETEDDQERIAKKGEIMKKYVECSEYIHALHQLLKAYTLFEKDVEYIIQNGKVVIVDEHTGRLMPGRRFSEGLHSAIEAKENVSIQEETKTLATITLQNLFRMFSKLAGMTGTAETEASEFMHIYKLPVIVIPTNRSVVRKDYNDLIFIRKDEKIKQIVERILKLHNAGIPILVGTASVQSSENLDMILKGKKNIAGKPLKYNILNARQHEKEANVVQEAGLQGAITIATNMAGRGTDIKLGKTLKMLPERSALIGALLLKDKLKQSPAIIYADEKSAEYLKFMIENDDYLKDKSLYFYFFKGELTDSKIPICSYKDEGSFPKNAFEKIYIPDTENLKERNVCISYDEKGKCTESVPYGLYVLGTEKHESRRIDRQLRGRSGRQGDPGASLFTVSLEDDLMRIFGNERMSDLIKRLESLSDREASVSHKLLTSSIETAQKRIEGLNFDRRKYLLEYDDVINKQREIVYQLRNFFLERKPPIEYIDPAYFSQTLSGLSENLKKFDKDAYAFREELKKFSFYMQSKELIDITIKDIEHGLFEEKIKNHLAKQFSRNLTEVKDYILDNIPQISEDFIYETIDDNTPFEDWPYERINEYLLNYFKFSVKKNDEELSKKALAEQISKAVEDKFKDNFAFLSGREDILLFNLCNIFIMSIDKLWVDQLYELDAVKEGISLRGYAQRDPLVEFKKESYQLFNTLMDNIYKDFSERFFSAAKSVEIKTDKPRRIDAVKKDVTFANSPEDGESKNKPITRENKKIGRNDPCWCGSGKKFKNCHGKDV